MQHITAGVSRGIYYAIVLVLLMRRSGGVVVSDADCCAVSSGIDTRPGQLMSCGTYSDHKETGLCLVIIGIGLLISL